RAEVGRQVAAGLAHRVEQESAQLVRKPLQLALFEAPQLVRVVDRLQQVVHPVKNNLPAGRNRRIRHQNFLRMMKSASWRRRSARSPNPASASRASERSSPASSRARATPIVLT